MVLLALVLVTIVLYVRARINDADSAYELQSLLRNQHSILSSHRWAQVKEVDSKEVEAAFIAGFVEGKALLASGAKPKTVIKYETKEVPVESPCNPGESLMVKASVTEATVEDAAGTLFFNGWVRVSLDHPSTNWHKDIDLPVERSKIDYKIVAPEPPQPRTEAKRWRLGKSVGCGVGVTASANVVPAPNAGVGVGVFCGVSWGLVK